MVAALLDNTLLAQFGHLRLVLLEDHQSLWKRQYVLKGDQDIVMNGTEAAGLLLAIAQESRRICPPESKLMLKNHNL